MVDGQDVVSVDGADAPADALEDTVTISTADARAIREALQLLSESGIPENDYPWLPDHGCILRFVVLRTFADSEIDPKMAIRNAEQYIHYILHGLTVPESDPVSPMKRRLRAI